MVVGAGPYRCNVQDALLIHSLETALLIPLLMLQNYTTQYSLRNFQWYILRDDDEGCVAGTGKHHRLQSSRKYLFLFTNNFISTLLYTLHYENITAF